MLLQEKRRKNGKEGRREGGRLCEHNMHQAFDIQPYTKDSRDKEERKKSQRITARHGNTHVAGVRGWVGHPHTHTGRSPAPALFCFRGLPGRSEKELLQSHLHPHYGGQVRGDAQEGRLPTSQRTDEPPAKIRCVWREAGTGNSKRDEALTLHPPHGPRRERQMPTKPVSLEFPLIQQRKNNPLPGTEKGSPRLSGAHPSWPTESHVQQALLRIQRQETPRG